MTTSTKPNHIGRKISRIRELRDMKQETLAFTMGVSQQTISHMENSETIEYTKLLHVAKALGVCVEAITNFSDEAVINKFTQYYDTSSKTTTTANDYSFNPLNKLVEAFDKLARAHEEKERLYQQLVESEKEKVIYLERMLRRK